jgi:spermidine synthase
VVGPERRLLVASLLSGAAALVYQVLWARELTLSLGSTVGAVATVLASFMAGLGLGGALAARALRDRRPSPRVYAALEVAIAVTAVALPPLLRRSGFWLAVLEPGASTVMLAAARATVTAALLLVPTMAMGATLPVLTAVMGATAESAGRVAGRLYAANTLGAVAGALGTPLALLSAIGMWRSGIVAAGLNLAAAVLVGSVPRALETEPPTRAATAIPHLPASRGRVALWVAGLSGLGALAHEVAWTRTMILLLGPTAYSFAFVVATAIAGIALGSAVFGRFADRISREGSALAWVQVATAVASLAVTQAAGSLPVPVAELIRAQASHPGRLLLLELLGVLALLVWPCLFFGATFPLAVAKVAQGGRPIGHAVGEVYAWNTAGAVAGALLAGFLIMPLLGTQGTLLAAATVHAVAGILAAADSAHRGLFFGSILLSFVPPVVLPRWDPELMAGGVYRYVADESGTPIDEQLRSGDLLFHREGRAATVTVKRSGRTLSLAIDGKVEASSTGDMLTQRILAHLPLLLHPRPQTACIVGLGSGATAGAALRHPLARLDVLELSPEVVAASGLFQDFNQDALSDPRLRLLVADGRHHFRFGRERYDVIASEPSNPWMPGASALFTEEAFREERSRLAPGGLLAQWVQLYGLELVDLRRVVAGFLDVFPRASLFLLSEGDAVLLGPDDAWTAPSAEELRSRLDAPAIKEDLASVKVVTPFVFASLHALEGDALRAWAGNMPRHTDDRPLLELRSARSVMAETGATNHAAVAEAARRATRSEPWKTLSAANGARDLADRAAMLEEAGAPVWAFAIYTEAFRRAPDLADAREGLVRTALRAEAIDLAAAELRQAAGGAVEADVRTALAALLDAAGRNAEAARELELALRLDARHVGALAQAAALQAREGQMDASFRLAARAAALAPDDPEPRTLLATALLARGRAQEAQAEADRVLAGSPRYPGALAVGAQARMALGQTDEARGLLERLVEADPEDWAAENLRGRLEMDAGRPGQAAEAFERSVELSFANRPGWEGLLAAARRLGNRALSARCERALRRLPTISESRR